jgi:hypothetical protein
MGLDDILLGMWFLLQETVSSAKKKKQREKVREKEKIGRWFSVKLDVCI